MVEPLAIGAGRYQPLTPLASGGLATVWLARDLRSGGAAALKIALPSAPASLLEREARWLLACRSPHVLALLDSGGGPDPPALALEYVHGVSLARALDHAARSRTPLRPALAVRIARDLCAALAAVHAASDRLGAPLGLVHADVNPRNVLLGADGAVKLCDFNLARRAAEPAPGGAIGTIAYASAEVARGEPPTIAADLFAAAVILWEMLRLERYRRPGDGAAALLQAAEGAHRPLAAGRRDLEPLGPVVDGVIQRPAAVDAVSFSRELQGALGEGLADRAEIAALVADSAREELARRELYGLLL